jgi:hypothetical protein
MLYKNYRRVLLATLLLSSLVLSQHRDLANPIGADVARLRAHVEYLASDKLEGRKAGAPGAKEAAAYISREFRNYELKPAASGNAIANATTKDPYLQPFPFVAGVDLGKRNELELTRRGDPTQQIAPLAIDLRVGDDWMPLGFSSNARIENAPVAFVGYGITAADQNYDDYKDAGVADKIALAFSGTPDGDNPHGKFTRAGELRFKTAAARAAGARALVIVAGELNFKEDKLARLSYDNSGGDAGMPVVVVSRQAGAKILGASDDAQLTEMERVARTWGVSGQASSDVHGYRITMTRKNEMTKGIAITLETDVVRRNTADANVVGVLEGSDAKLKNEVIVLGAHYDHLGRGGRGSLAGREGEIHHGADDNASGTSALLELARTLSQDRSRMRRTVVFIAFGGEEDGLLGSSYYVNHPALPLEQTVAMINLDMVGRLREGALTVAGVGTANEWRGWLEGVNTRPGIKVNLTEKRDRAPQASGAATSTVANIKAEVPIVTTSDGRVIATADPARRFNLRLSDDGFGPSDHSSFYARRVPVLFFFTGSHEDYHKPTDTADRINYDGLASITGFVRDIVLELQSSNTRPTYAVAKVEATARSTGFRVYLGTVPSYAESTDGLKLDAVRDASPAASAGLKAGDRIVKLAGRDVRNVYDYTQALSEMKAGQEYEVEIVRDEKRMTMKITPAARK